MTNISDSLKRKLGPLPAWAWAIIAFILVWYYRRKFSGTTNQTTTSLTPTNAQSPQDPVPLSPGESVYDPNTGALVNTPGALAGPTDTTGSSGAVDFATAIDDLANAIAGGMTVTTQPTNTPDGTTSKPAMTAKSKRQWNQKFNQRFNQRWLKAHPKAAAKRSRASVKKVARSKPTQTHTQASGRSHSLANGSGPEYIKPGSPNYSKAKALYTPGSSRARSRPKTPLTYRTTRQRPVASHPVRNQAHNTPHQQHSSQKSAPRTRRHK